MNKFQREREREKQRETERDRETVTERDRETETERDRERQSQRDRDRETDCLFTVLVLISLEGGGLRVSLVPSLAWFRRGQPPGRLFLFFFHCLYLFLFIIYFRSKC